VTTPATPTPTVTPTSTSTSQPTTTPTATPSPTPRPRLYVVPLTVTAGATVYAMGAGFGATETVLLKWNSATGITLHSTVSSAQGVFITTVAIPRTVAPGQHLIFAVGQTSHATATALVTVR
jgi:hypothetical protein